MPIDAHRLTSLSDHPITGSPDHPILRLSLNIPMSLSPRPETFTINRSDFFIFGARLMHSAPACADSSAGMIPSVRDRRLNASTVSSSQAPFHPPPFPSPPPPPSSP